MVVLLLMGFCFLATILIVLLLCENGYNE